MFAIQYVNRPGNGHGGFVVNDGSHTVFVPACTQVDTRRLYTWLGNGDSLQGERLYNSPVRLSMPAVMLNPAQYNTLVGSMVMHDVQAFIKEG